VIAVDALPQRTVGRDEGKPAVALVEQLNAAGVKAMSLEDALRESVGKAPPEVLIEPASPHLLALHRVRDDGQHVHFITNTSADACNVVARVHAAGDAWVCWPRTGAIEARTLGADGLSLAVGPYEGVFIVTR